MTTIIILNHIVQEMIKASKNKSLEPQHYHENVTTYNSGNYIRTLKWHADKNEIQQQSYFSL